MYMEAGMTNSCGKHCSDVCRLLPYYESKSAYFYPCICHHALLFWAFPVICSLLPVPFAHRIATDKLTGVAAVLRGRYNRVLLEVLPTHPPTHPVSHPLTNSLTLSFTHSATHRLTHSLTPTHSLTHSLTHPLSHSPNQSLNR
jgi:hypothetical protein